MPTRRDATAPAPDRQTRARGGHEWIPCISSLGSSVPGLIPCIISLDAALLSSIYTKSFGEPSPLGRRSPKPPTLAPTFEHGGPTPTRARTCGLRISTHTTHVHPFASAIRCHSRPSAQPRSPPAAPQMHAASSGHGAAPRYPRGAQRQLRDLRAAHTRGGCERGVRWPCGRGGARPAGGRGEMCAPAAP